MEELDPVLTRFSLAHVDLEIESQRTASESTNLHDPDSNCCYLDGLNVLAVPNATERFMVELQERAECLNHWLASVMVHHVDLVWLLSQ